MTIKPKTRKAPAALVDEVEQRRVADDLDFADELNRMAARFCGLEAAIAGASSFSACGERDGVLQIADDIGRAMERLAEAFDAERKLREAEQRQ